jgi:hypothetical protein
VRVGEPRGDLDLAQEPLGTEDGGEFGPKDLDGDLPMMPQILCKLDRSHPAVSQFLLDAIAGSESRLRQARRTTPARQPLQVGMLSTGSPGLKESASSGAGSSPDPDTPARACPLSHEQEAL